jgi:hypothetical protein
MSSRRSWAVGDNSLPLATGCAEGRQARLTGISRNWPGRFSEAGLGVADGSEAVSAEAGDASDGAEPPENYRECEVSITHGAASPLLTLGAQEAALPARPGSHQPCSRATGVAAFRVPVRHGETEGSSPRKWNPAPLRTVSDRVSRFLASSHLRFQLAQDQAPARGPPSANAFRLSDVL